MTLPVRSNDNKKAAFDTDQPSVPCSGNDTVAATPQIEVLQRPLEPAEGSGASSVVRGRGYSGLAGLPLRSSSGMAADGLGCEVCGSCLPARKKPPRGVETATSCSSP